ncbi:MAG: nitronate monooxygenase [Lachnospiraceae bacterium]|nr:nitronate monooxygenase [Lachnospiraceae bacterium]
MKHKPLKIGELTAKIPVIQGGMGVGISLSRLAGAVAAEGGIGVLSAAQIGYRDSAYDQNPVDTNLRCLKEEIKKAKELAGGGIIGVNIMVATKFYEDYVRAAVEADVDLIICGAGLPNDLPKLVDGSRTKIAPIVSTLKSVRVICKMWDKHYHRVPDLVIIEGPEAGGHLGFTPKQLEEYDEQAYDQEIAAIIEHVRTYEEAYAAEIPVVVAGGIYERKDLEKYLEMGASGVQMGTRFVTTYECDADERYKQAYLKAKQEDIIIVKSPVGMPGRAIKNPFIEKTMEHSIPMKKCHQCITACNQKDIPYCITDALINAAIGEVDEALLFCGSNAYRAEKIEHVSDIMQEFA